MTRLCSLGCNDAFFFIFLFFKKKKNILFKNSIVCELVTWNFRFFDAGKNVNVKCASGDPIEKLQVWKLDSVVDFSFVSLFRHTFFDARINHVYIRQRMCVCTHSCCVVKLKLNIVCHVLSLFIQQTLSLSFSLHLFLSAQ